MTFATWCLPITMFLPLIWVYVAKSKGRGYDNDVPRDWYERQEGMAKRANWAQQNSYEAFPPFAAAVILAQVNGTDPMLLNILAGAFVLARILHGVFYIQDKSTARTLVWLAGFGLTIAIFVVQPGG